MVFDGICICLELYGVIYVDELNGTLVTKCGLTRPMACRHLSTAVNQSSGVIHIIGDITLNATIPLTNDVHLTTNEEDQGRIIGVGKVAHAFVVKKSNITVYITNISFVDIGVLQTSLTANAFVHNIHAIGGKGYLFHAQKGMELASVIFSISYSTFMGTNGVVYAKGDKRNRFSVNVDVADSTFIHTGGLSVTHSNGNVNIHNCTFKHHHRKRPVGVRDVRTATITSSTFSNNTYKYGSVGLQTISKVLISNCTFINGTGTDDSYPGCIMMLRVTDSLMEHSTFTQCHTKGASAGALFIHSPKNASVVRNCSFTRNKAMKSGGAIYITYMEYYVQRQVGTTLIENCTFQNNEAVDVGQSVHSTGKCYVNLQNITILTRGNNEVTHLQLEGNIVTIGNVKLIQDACMGLYTWMN